MAAGAERPARRTLAALALLALACRAGEPEAPEPPPAPGRPEAPRAVVLFVADDLSRDDVGAWGGRDARTPAFDGLASAGLRFDGAHAVTAICQPSRAALLTGLHPHSNGVYGFYGLADGVVPLPALLARAGWLTGIVGKSHLQPLAAYGFEFERVSAPRSEASRSPERLAADVAAFLVERARRGAPPCFLWVAPHDPHRPFPASGVAPEDVTVPAWLPDLPEVRAERAGYAAAVERLDRALGLVLTELERAGLADDALVLATSDHGAPFPFAKTTLYEAGLAVPLAVRWPGRVAPGGATSALVSLVDVAPTVLELAGVAAPRSSEGRSFARLLRAPGGSHRSHLFATQTDQLRLPSRPIRSVRDARFHYLFNFAPELPLTSEAVTTPSFAAMSAAAERDGEVAARVLRLLHPPAEELYDLAADPAELRDLAADPAHAGELERQRARLLADMRELRDPLLFVLPGADEADRARTRDAYDAWRAVQAARAELEAAGSAPEPTGE